MRLVPFAIGSNPLAAYAEPKAIEVIKALTSELTSDVVETLIEQGTPLWDCVPEDHKDKLQRHMQPLAFYTGVISDAEIKGWVIKARPDFADVLSKQEGLEWFKDFMKTIRASVKSGDS